MCGVQGGLGCGGKAERRIGASAAVHFCYHSTYSCAASEAHGRLHVVCKKEEVVQQLSDGSAYCEFCLFVSLVSLFF